MDNLRELESKSIYIIREAYNKFRNPAALWSCGKDSTAMLWLCRKAFFGRIPFKVIHLDTGFKFRQIYEFRDSVAAKWNLNLEIAGSSSAVKPEDGRFKCCNARKTETLKDALKAGRHDAVLAGIRSDEHGIRSKERYFSPRDKGFRWNVFRRKRGASGDSAFSPMQDAELSGWNIFATEFGKETSHVRVHPLLHWTELDVWEYVKKEKIPVVPLYFARNGKRFRSIGCKCCCSPVESNARNISDIIAELKATNLPERAGRAQDKESEHMMERLRALGYM